MENSHHIRMTDTRTRSSHSSWKLNNFVRKLDVFPLEKVRQHQKFFIVNEIRRTAWKIRSCIVYKIPLRKPLLRTNITVLHLCLHSVPSSSTYRRIACAAGGIVLLKFWRRSRDPKKGVGTRRLKYRLPENPGILNSSHTSVRRNGLVEGYTYVNHSRWSFAWSFSYFPRERMVDYCEKYPFSVEDFCPARIRMKAEGV